MLKVTPKNLILALCCVGLGISLYLTYAKLTASPIFCKYGDCDKVQNSPYSAIMGIPVAMFGIAYYLTQFVFTYKGYKRLELVWLGWGFLFSTYLTYLEIYVIKAICMWCVISYVVVILMCLLKSSGLKTWISSFLAGQKTPLQK